MQLTLNKVSARVSTLLDDVSIPKWKASFEAFVEKQFLFN